MYRDLIRDLSERAHPEKAAFFPRFFKTGPGQYGEGDSFLGVTVPEIRNAIREYKTISLRDIQKLLKHRTHEFRLAGLLILVGRYAKANAKGREVIVDFYLSNVDRVNNWDLVDSSAPQILGAHVFETDSNVLDRFAKSGSLWRERIAIVGTQYLIRRNRYEDTLRIAETLLSHPHDLIHKAVGWMLREVGNREKGVLEKFLRKHYKTMPRTMLRYAIEKFSEPERKKYLSGSV